MQNIRVISFAVLALGFSSVFATPPASDRKAAILYLLRQDCGACHGMNLLGGLGPALKPDSLAKWNTVQVAQTILKGRPGTPMPPWQPFLTPDEALWLAVQLKQGIRP